MKVETRDVLAAVYVRINNPLTHSYVEDETYTLCGRIPADHLADGADPNERPTCKRCLKLDPRFI